MRNSVILIILLLIFGESCVSRPKDDPEFLKRLNNIIVYQVNEILDKMCTPEFWEQKSIDLKRYIFSFSSQLMPEEKLSYDIEPISSVQIEIDFLLKNKDIALPLIFKRLDGGGANVSGWAGKDLGDFYIPRNLLNREGGLKTYIDYATVIKIPGVKTRQLMIFFYIFCETKSIESIPYLCEFLRSFPEGMRSTLQNSLGSMRWAIEAIEEIMGGKIYGRVLRREVSSAEIADQAEKWYEEYKRKNKP